MSSGDTDVPDMACAASVRVPAAQYVRMSTEHQRYSTENQAGVIAQYAERRGFKIVQTYADEGKSGLRLDGRDALKQLIDDVQAGPTGFTTILVYDVSRWGRFQDADESAYYEHVCKRAGITVQYCAEQFENDGSLSATIIKGMKRAMAGEYSRELSVKVFTGQCRLIELGYRQGGPAGFGLRRMLLDERNMPKGELARGEHKSLQTDRLSKLLAERGELSGLIIDEVDGMPSSSAYQSRFGSLLRAYQLVGYTPSHDYRYVEINRVLRRMYPGVVTEAIAAIEGLGGTVWRDPVTDLLTVNGEFTASVVIVRCQETLAGAPRWKIRFETGLRPDITVAIRMAAGNQDVFDYYLLPRVEIASEDLRLREYNGVYWDAYRFDTLDRFFHLSARANIRFAA